MQAVRLRTEYLKNPIGIDVKNPRVSWNCEGGKKQEAYEIRVLDEEEKEVYTSGKVNSHKMHLVSLDGFDPDSKQRYTWQVRLMEKDVFGEWSEPASFEIGLLSPSDWKGKWITGNYKPDKKTKYPVDYFKKEIRPNPNKKVKKARVYFRLRKGHQWMEERKWKDHI